MRRTSVGIIAAIVVIVAVGSFFLPDFLSVKYLIQQLRIASFLGIIATGAMVVILLGHIDLSIPWTMTVAAMANTTRGNIAQSAVMRKNGFSIALASARTKAPWPR